jgi:hypothetical protein
MILYWVAGAAAVAFCAFLICVLALTVSVSRLRSHSGGPLKCGYCGSADLRPSWPAGARDRIYQACGCEPYRCRACYHRFYRAVPRAAEADEAGQNT